MNMSSPVELLPVGRTKGKSNSCLEKIQGERNARIGPAGAGIPARLPRSPCLTAGSDTAHLQLHSPLLTCVLTHRGTRLHFHPPVYAGTASPCTAEGAEGLPFPAPFFFPVVPLD